MTTSKPRTEIPKIEPIADQEFLLSKEEVMKACAQYVISHRTDSRFGKDPRPYRIISTSADWLRITLQETK